MAEQDYATVDGVKVPKADFGYAPGDKPSEWKFPLDTKARVESAIDMFHHEKGIPAAAMQSLKRKIIARAHTLGVDADKITRFEARAVSASEVHIAILLTNAGAAVDTPSEMAMQQPGAQLREIAVAVPGAWSKDGRKFSITKQDLADMVGNFEKRKNDMIVVDYEHASEDPQVARGGPVPGAGWIHALRANGALTALVEWTPQAEEMLRTGQYRFFSPAINWGATDKTSGEPQGATLTSGALTNHPFLEELPPIMLSDGTIITAGTARQIEEKGATTMAEEKEKEPNELPKLKIRKGSKGSKQEGNHVLSDGDADVGYMSEEDLAAHAKAHLGVNPDATQDGNLADPEESLSEAAKQTLAESRRRARVLTEIASTGRVDAQKAIALSEAGKITFADYVRAQEAEKLIDSAITNGKILPRDRKFFFRDALERPAEFSEYVAAAPQAVRFGAAGIGEGQALSANDEIDLSVKKARSENAKLSYADALKQLLRENPALAERRRKAASVAARIDSDAAPHNGGVVF